MPFAELSYTMQQSTHGVTGINGGKGKYPLNISQKKSFIHFVRQTHISYNISFAHLYFSVGRNSDALNRQKPINRVGGISLNLRNSDLSHHRAYRSVHGGSINLTSNTPFGVVI